MGHTDQQERTRPASDDPRLTEAAQRAAGELSSVRTKVIGLAETREYPADINALEGQVRAIAPMGRERIYDGFAKRFAKLGRAEELDREALMQLAEDLNAEIRYLNALKPGQVTGPTP